MVTADPPRRARGDAGFSFVELLVAMTISVLVMGTTLYVTTQTQNSYRTQLDGAAVQEEVRYTLEWIGSILRTAGSNAQNITVSSCPAAGNTFRAIRRDPNADNVQNDIRVHADTSPPNGLLGGQSGACTEAGEDLTIAYDAANRVVTRRDNNVGNVAVPVTDSVISQVVFTYLDSNRVATNNDALVAYVRVLVSAQTPFDDPYTGQPRTFTQTAEYRVRGR